MELIGETNSDENDFYENVDFELLCRLCCKPSRIPLIPIYFDETDELPLKIKSYLPINISMDDELPQKICFKCVNNVFLWHDFFQNCINADSKLRHILSQKRPLNCAVKETNIKTESLEPEEVQGFELEGENYMHVKDEAESIPSEEEIDCGFKDSNSVYVPIKKQKIQINKDEDKNHTDAHQNTNAQTTQIPIHSDVKVRQLCQQNLDFQILKSKMDQNNQFDDKLKRKRELAYMRLKKHRKIKREEAQQQNLVSQNEPNKQSNKQIQQNKLERKRELSRERSRRYRAKKRLCKMKTFEHAIHDSQIPGPSNANPPLVIKNQTTRSYRSSHIQK